MSTATDQRFREANLRIHALSRGLREPAEYLCECGSSTCCATMITLQPSEFADVLAQRAGLVFQGHENPGMQIVRQGRGYLIVSGTQEIDEIEETTATRE